MSLRLSDIRNCMLSVDAMARASDSPVLQAMASPSIAPEPEPLLSDAELLALCRVKRSTVSIALAEQLVREGVSVLGAFRSMRARGFLRVKDDGFHECTAMGWARADTLASEAARPRGMHVVSYRHDRGHMYRRASNSLHCTCGWGVNTGGSAGGDVAARHLKDAADGTLPQRFVLPPVAPEVAAPGIVPGDT